MPGEYHVFLGQREAERICRYLGLSRAWFRRRYLRRLEDGQLSLAAAAGGSCIFLDHTQRCSIYAARPAQCRTYPFWPEIAGNRRAWLRERQRCEGIGRGSAVPLAQILRALKNSQPG